MKTTPEWWLSLFPCSVSFCPAHCAEQNNLVQLREAGFVISQTLNVGYFSSLELWSRNWSGNSVDHRMFHTILTGTMTFLMQHCWVRVTERGHPMTPNSEPFLWAFTFLRSSARFIGALSFNACVLATVEVCSQCIMHIYDTLAVLIAYTYKTCIFTVRT